MQKYTFESKKQVIKHFFSKNIQKKFAIKIESIKNQQLSTSIFINTNTKKKASTSGSLDYFKLKQITWCIRKRR